VNTPTHYKEKENKMRGDKAKKIREALVEFGSTFNDREIAEMVGATQSFVYKLRSKEKYKTTRAKVTKKAKEQAIAKNAELGKKIVKRGRPSKNDNVKTTIDNVKTTNDNLKDAVAVMMDLVSKYKNLFVSFDSKRDLVEFMWQDEVYQVPPQEVEQILSAMKYLDGKKLAWKVE
jgi:hypothetical protein